MTKLIRIEGLDHPVEIEGDVPTPEEEAAINQMLDDGKVKYAALDTFNPIFRNFANKHFLITYVF